MPSATRTPNLELLQTNTDREAAKQVIEALIVLHGLDFVLRLCAKAAFDREASYRAVLAFNAHPVDQ